MTDALVVDTATRLFADICDHAALRAAERDGWAERIWEAAAGAGLPWISVPVDAGGSGGSLADALAVLEVAGRFAAPVPLAETMLAGWLLSAAGLPMGDGPMTVATVRSGDSLRVTGSAVEGTVHRVPWGRRAERVVLLVEHDGAPTIVALDRGTFEVQGLTNLAGEPRDTLVLRAGPGQTLAPAPPGIDATALRTRGALGRVMLIAGAFRAVHELTVAYTHERRQFGKAVASFQAVQQHLVTCAEEYALVAMAADTVRRGADGGPDKDADIDADPEPAQLHVAWAKLLANRGADRATRAAHQAHGAIGMTQEYVLHHFTRRLWAWRSEYGDDRYWSSRAGAMVAAAGPDALYPLIADEPAR